MALHFLRTSILVLLSLLTGGVALIPPVSFGNEIRHFLLFEEDADSDDVEESSKSKLIAALDPCIGLCNQVGFHAVSDEVNHQIDWLFVHEHAARAPPLG